MPIDQRECVRQILEELSVFWGLGIGDLSRDEWNAIRYALALLRWVATPPEDVVVHRRKAPISFAAMTLGGEGDANAD